MKNMQWLLKGNPVICRLTRKYLLNECVESSNDGYISEYLSLYDTENHQWGGGFYGPKWVSSHYTMMELMYMEINPNNQKFNDAFKHLFTYLWKTYHHPKKQYLDMCIAGMLLKMASYIKVFNDDIKELIDYVLAHKMSDGGWNCMLLRSGKPKISSVHTTLSILEAFDVYEKTNYNYRIEDIKKGLVTGVNCLLERRLIYKKTNDSFINKYVSDHHYPPRWKYDYLRVLEFLAKRQYPLCDELVPALNHLKTKLKHGRLGRGSLVPGAIHLKLEPETYGYFNTLRAYKVLKVYDESYYKDMIEMSDIS